MENDEMKIQLAKTFPLINMPKEINLSAADINGLQKSLIEMRTFAIFIETEACRVERIINAPNGCKHCKLGPCGHSRGRAATPST